MRQVFLFLMACLLLINCGGDSKHQPFSLQGAWVLSRAEYPIGRIDTFPINGPTYLRLYDGDSMMVQSHLTRISSSVIVRPQERCDITLIDKGGGEHLYLEDGDPFPLTVKDDTTIIIQQNGILHTWLRADDIAKDWGDDISNIVDEDLREGDKAGKHYYVLSAKEREQASFIHWLFLAIFLLIVVSLQYIIINRRERKWLHAQLRQIMEEHEKRPQPVRKAILSVEEEYFASDDYQSLQRRISTGQRLKDEEWTELVEQVRNVYPGFTSQLRNLYAMSELEYQVCLLIKLRMAPSNIASVLARDVSTISTVRSRLYKKVFGKKGGAKEWDEFILSIGS
jgi:hypothetical protein